MQVTIQYAAQARNLLGRASESLELAGPTPVRELILRLSRDHEKLRRLLVTDAGEPHPSLLLFVGEEQVESRSGHLLKAGDVISILPPIAGG
jgi:molybdopterin converting factor small subunit